MTFKDKCRLIDRLERMLAYGKIRLLPSCRDMTTQQPDGVPNDLWQKWVYAKQNLDKRVVLASDPTKKQRRKKTRKAKSKIDKPTDPAQLVIKAMKAALINP